MKRADLTQSQKKTFDELKEFIDVCRLNYEDTLNNISDRDAVIPILNSIRDQVIISTVVYYYVFMDEFLNYVLAKYYINTSRSSKKFQIFQNNVLDELYFIKKLEAVRKIKKLPKFVVQGLQDLNGIRNGVAHFFDPKRLKKNKPIYKNESIYTIKGISLLVDDMEKINSYFLKTLYKIDLDRIQF